MPTALSSLSVGAKSTELMRCAVEECAYLLRVITPMIYACPFPDDFPGALQVSSCPPSHPNLLRLSLFVTAPLFLVAHRLSPAGSANS